jgi:hypothetical protein
MTRATALAGVLAAMLFGAPLAQAQVQPPLEDIVVQGEILNRTIDQATGAPRQEGGRESGEIDGEAGIYVLTVNEIFFVSGSAGFGHTTNPTRTASDPGEDWYGEFNASIGVATRIAGSVDFAASLNVDGRDFFEADDASSRGVSVTAAVGAPVSGSVYGSVIAFAGYAFDDQFSNETSFYGLAGNLSASWKVSDQFLIRPGIGVTQQWSDVSENNSLSATASVDAVYVLTPEWMLAGRVSVSQRNYDDFYEDVTFVEREDTTAGVSASLVWRPNRSMTLSASVSYEDQDSTFFLSEFDAFDTGVGVSFRHAF